MIRVYYKYNMKAGASVKRDKRRNRFTTIHVVCSMNRRSGLPGRRFFCGRRQGKPKTRKRPSHVISPLTNRGAQGNLSRMRIVFMGADNIALPSFKRLLTNADVAGLVTQPDRPVGRHQVLLPPALKVLAEEADVPVLQPESLRRDGAIERIAEFRPDLIVVMAYGQILPDELIRLAPCGCINVHASLLPRHRGASCIASSIRSGDRETGVSVMDVARRLDTGDVIRASGFRLMGKETAGILHQALGELAPNVLMDVIATLASGAAVRTPQDESLATYAPKLSRRDGLIDWSAPALEIERQIRAFDPWPGTYTMFKDRKGRLKKLKVFPYALVLPQSGGGPGEVVSVDEKGVGVACGEGVLALGTVQPEGGRRMSVCEFAAGYDVRRGMSFAREEES